MAKVLDSPHSSPLSSRPVLSINLPVGGAFDLPGGQLPSSRGRSSSGAATEVDPFVFESEDEHHQKGDEQSTVPNCRKEGENNFIESLLVDNSSQLSLLSQKSHASLQPTDMAASQEMMTQNAADFTQMTQDANDASLSQSPFPPKSPISPLQVPWGRLMPCNGGPAVELKPKAPATVTSRTRRGASYAMIGLEQLDSSDIFNTHTLGRSPKVCVTAYKPTSGSQDKEQRIQDWAFALISNRHCQIYCTLPEDPQAACLPGSISLPAATMQIWVEDSSNNGTMINGNILLKRGQKRRLHSGDEISLVIPETLRKKIRDNALLRKTQQQYSFVFVNVSNQQQQASKLKPAPPKPSNLFPMPPPGMNLTSSAKRRRGLVNPRAMNYSNNGRSPLPQLGAHRSPLPSELGYGFAQPTPKSGHNRNGNRSRGWTAALDQSEAEQPSSSRRIEQEYDVRDLLGRGICEVRRAIHRQTGKERAVKIVSLPSPGLLSHKQQEETKQLKKEAEILRSLKHPYIVDLVDVFTTKTHMYLVMEICAGGDLFDRIVKHTKYSEKDSRRCTRRLLSAIHYIHEDCQLVHRDLKPENVLLTSVNDSVDLKITDFGVAKSALADLKTFCGTPSYIAPEVLKRRHTVFGKGQYGKSADMWSLGVILYILISGTPPYDIDGAAGMDVVLQSSLKIQFPEKHWSGISAEAKDLVSRMLSKDPRSRLSVQEAMAHPWILMEDGDTHRHPLEDPKLIAITKKRLFSSLNLSPTLVSTSASTSKQAQPRKRRKVSMENDPALGTKAIGDGSSDISRSPAAPLVAPPQRPLSPVENRCSSPSSSSPPASPTGVAKRLLVTKNTGENDENCNLETPSKVITAPESKKTDAPNAVSETKPPRPTKKSKVDGLVMAAELDDDKICSQFTDEEVSISSFGNSAPASLLSAPLKKESGKDKTGGKGTKAMPSKSSKKTGGAAAKKAKSSGTSKSAKASKTDDAEGSQKQPTLARWFQPVKKS